MNCTEWCLSNASLNGFQRVLFLYEEFHLIETQTKHF